MILALTRESLIQYMVENFHLQTDELSDDTKLFSSGLLDSFGLVDLISFIEKEMGQSINVADVTLDHFDSIGRIMAFVGQM